jgi:hypothetical protein
MKTRILRDDTELLEFARRFGARGNPVAIEYLRRARPRAFFDRRGAMTAGYVLNRSFPLRYMEWIPRRRRSGLSPALREARCCELTCIWIERKGARCLSERVYARAVLDALLSGADYALGGTLNGIVYGMQSQVFPDLLYAGPTDYFGRQQACWVYGASRRVLLARLLFFFPVQLVRGLSGRSRYLGRALQRARSAGYATPPRPTSASALCPATRESE